MCNITCYQKHSTFIIYRSGVIGKLRTFRKFVHENNNKIEKYDLPFTYCYIFLTSISLIPDFVTKAVNLEF